MKKKTAPAMTVVSKTIKTTFKNLIKDIEDFPQEIVRAAIHAGLHPTGPQYWIYTWKTCDMETDFELKICLPVATFGKSFTSKIFKLEKVDEFVHVKKIHLGAWENLKISYDKLIDKIKREKLLPGKTCREVYFNCDFENTENNITEIQYQVS